MKYLRVCLDLTWFLVELDFVYLNDPKSIRRRQSLVCFMIRVISSRGKDGTHTTKRLLTLPKVDPKNSPLKLRYTDRRIGPYNRNPRAYFNARRGHQLRGQPSRGQPLRGQIVPVTHYLDRVHNELVKQLGDKYLSLLDEFRKQHPELVSVEDGPASDETERNGVESC